MESFRTIKDLQRSLRKKELSSKELLCSYLDNIDSKDDSVNSFITIDREFSLKQAEHADKMFANGTATPMTGIPIAHKDIFCTKGLTTTCGSKIDLQEQFHPRSGDRYWHSMPPDNELAHPYLSMQSDLEAS